MIKRVRANPRDDGRQRLVHQRWFTIKPFYAAAILTGALVVLAVVVQHKLPDVTVMAVTFTAAVGATVARLRDLVSKRPKLSCESAWWDESERLRESPVYRWVALLVTGSATVGKVSWRVRTANDPSAVEIDTIDALHERLRELGLSEGEDYTIMNFTPGSPLEAGVGEIYFECTATWEGEARTLPTATSQVLVLEAVFEFESKMGERFEKVVHLLPAHGASRVFTAPPSARAPALC